MSAERRNRASSMPTSFTYRTPVQDWNLLELPADSDDAVPYDLSIKYTGDQLFVAFDRFGVNVADIMIEVNMGVPALHLGTDEEASVHAHFAHDGIVFAPEDTTQTLFREAECDRYSYQNDDAKVAAFKGPGVDDKRIDTFHWLCDHYQFGGRVSDCGRPSVADDEDGGNTLCMKVELDHDDDNENQWVMFKVRFVDGTTIPCEVYALDLVTGNEIGSIA